jgi:twitching motility protein PilU
MIITPLLKLTVEKQASDLFLSVGSPVNIKIDGICMPINDQKMDGEMVRRIAYEMMTPEQIARFEQDMEMNFSFRIPDVGNFRINIFRQRGNVAIVIRYIRGKVLRVEKRNLPIVLKNLIMEKRGLVLVVGATSSGKSTTLASMIEHRNTLVSGHILTIEDPIEYLFRNNKSIINQREIGSDTLSYESALTSAMRESPDVVMVGEIRDRETL